MADHNVFISHWLTHLNIYEKQTINVILNGADEEVFNDQRINFGLKENL